MVTTRQRPPTPVSSPVLEAIDLSVTLGDVDVLDGVSFAVDPGERVLIRGPSGAGKTTLFDVLALLQAPSGGTLRVDGDDAAAIGERDRARLRRETVGVIFQDFQLVPDLTARENAAVPMEHAGRRDEDRLDELFEKLDLDDRQDHYPATLSGGEKQRVAVARALANQPAVVLADEPTGQLDPDTSDRVLELLLSLQDETGTALVVVSHDPRLAGVFEGVVRLRDGRLASE
jgi:putative ABC transport system ATP-binding protein